MELVTATFIIGMGALILGIGGFLLEHSKAFNVVIEKILEATKM